MGLLDGLEPLPPLVDTESEEDSDRGNIVRKAHMIRSHPSGMMMHPNPDGE